MFFRSERTEATYESELASVIAGALPEADEDTRRLVVAVAGLLGCAGYADRDFSEPERRLVADLLQTIHGVGQAQAEAILAVLRQNILQVSTVEVPRYARALRQLGNRELRLQVLEMLLRVAAADDDISQQEVVFLRQITTSLGLEQADYNQLQSQYRDLLRVLKLDQPGE
jgi:uncharacterized tellurite resistance protein B-like protein